MNRPTNEPLAIVGIGCRLPGGVTDSESFWELLINGRSGIIETPADRWDIDRYYHPDTAVPVKMHTKWGGFVDNVDKFDAAFFGISPREAQRMDPQQRWLLETSWEALEDAGIPPKTLRGTRTGVYVGIASNEYGSIQMMGEEDIDVHTNSGSTLSIASNRISYLFDLKGPSVSVDTACSSALVAINLACKSLWSGECDTVLAGGVNALLMPDASIGFSKATMLSPSGQCFAFDERANGYVRGEGAGMIAVKRLGDARRDANRIYATIRASVVNQDGNTSSMTVPGEDSQAAMLEEAYAQAGIEPNRVGYMEAHGTGTPVGDPIETRALGRVLCRGREEGNECIIGSVKSNIGHLESGSGIAGLIKAALVLHKQTVPPNLNYERPNPHIPFEELKLRVPVEAEPLPHHNGHPAVTAVNSFGFGGTNAHVVLEEVHPLPESEVSRVPEKNAHRPLILPISANGEAPLRATAKAMRTFLKDESIPLEDVCFSAAVHKDQLDDRLVIAANSRRGMRDRIREWLSNPGYSNGVFSGKPTVANSAPVFVFTGQGAQWWEMGQQLLKAEPVFRKTIDDIDALLKPLGGWSLVEEMTRDEASSKIDQTNIAQPAIFALQVALAALWDSWGVRPAKVVGHSVGEVAAAYVAGIYSLEDAVAIIYHRSRLQDTTGGHGRMVAVGVSPTEARGIIRGIEDRVQLAVINSPSMVTLAGDAEALGPVVEKLEAESAFVRWLRIDYAFHTHQMDPIREELLEVLAGIRPKAGDIPYISTVTGSELAGERMDAGYWWRNVRESVLFAPAIAKLIKDGGELFLELGPHPALQSAINECLSEQGRKGVVLHSLKRETDETLQMLENLARLHFQNVPVRWAAVNQSAESFVRLPSYPWNREKYWLECEHSRLHRLGKFDHPLLGLRQPTPEPTWEFLLDPRFFTYLNDHRFWDSIVFPAAGFGEIGLAVARTLFPGEPWVVEDLETTKALFISVKKVPLVRVVYREEAKAVEVFSRVAEGEWELNGRGTLRKLGERERGSVDLEAIRAVLPDHFDHEHYYEEYLKAGYQFGPNFQQVQNAWRKEGESLAEIIVPEQVCETVADYHFHPAVLDACFHAVKGGQIIPEESKPTEYFYLPASIRRIRLFVDRLPTHLWSHARIHVNDGKIVLCDIHVYDNDGKQVAEILGFRADRVDQKDEDTEGVDNSFYQFRWEPKRLHGSRVSEPLTFTPNAEIAATANEGAGVVFEKYQLGPYLGEYAPGSKALVGHVIENAYLALGWAPRIGDEVVFQQFVADLGIVPDHLRLAHAQLRALESDGILRRNDDAEDTWIVERLPERRDVITELEAMKERWPSCQAELALYEMTGPYLADVLSGEVDPLELLFPGGNSEVLERFYIEGADFLPNNDLISAAVAKALENLPERRSIRVLEVGAGTGSLTKAVLPVLPADRTEFTFTDNGPAFLNEAKKQFGEYEFVEYKIFDIEKSPEEQNIDVAGYDLILATNVIHATKDLKNTFANLKSCLVENGLLLFLEVTRTRRELDMIFGLLKGWWHFTDTDLRPQSAILPPDKWMALLKECGFEDVSSFDAIPDHSDLPPGQTAFCARLPESSTSAEEKEKPRIHKVGSFLEGESVPLAEADIVIHSQSLEPSDDLAGAQENGVLSLLSLAKELHQIEFESSPRVFVLTRGAQSVAGEPVASLHAAPITGFLRVARGEFPDFHWTQIDLDPETDVHEMEDIHEEHLLEDDGEREIAYRKCRRYGLRLHQRKAEELPVRTRNAVGEDGVVQYRLQISTPGILTNLTLNETSRREPEADEIEIQVKAGGINFRDVMKALGMYPGNPVDLRWFGDDFSGTVVRVGSKVTDVRPGDQVTGMAPYCFRAYVTVNRAMVFKKPAHLTHLQAATLPTVFLTTHYALNELAHLRPGEKVLIHAGTGGVGQAAIQVAKDIGAEIFATAGTREKRWLLREIGVDHVMDSRSLDFADEIMEITEGRGVDVVLNSLAGDFIPKSFSVLAPFGRFLEIGKIDVYGDSKLGLASMKDNISYFVIDLAQHLEIKPAYVAGMLDDIRKKLDAKSYQPLPHEVFPITDVVEAFRFMARGKHIGKNVLDFDVNDIQIAPSTNPDEFFKPDGTYLITGGAGGFGWELAKWMIAHGARSLCILSRSGPDGKVQAEIDALRADGVQLIDARGDVTKADDIDRIVTDIAENHPPLRGVIHGAMVLDDDFIIELDEDRFNKVAHPKMLGAWNLHQATLDCPLDHFIGFSSFSSVIGAIKQSNYNAGNYFLEALADHRHALGLPALTLNWGALTGAGFVDRNEKTLAYLEALGMKAYTMKETQYVMEQVLPHDPVRLAASRIEWPQLMKLSPALKANPTFATVGRKEGGDEGASIRPQILGAAPEERLGILEEFIAEQVAGVFGTEVSKIDRGTALTNIGLDSLMAIELINRIEGSLALSIPMSSVLNGPNIRELAVPILELLEQSSDGEEAAGAAAESDAIAKSSGGPDTFPLSEGQRALWFLNQLDRSSPAYNLVLSAKLTPLTDIDVMQKAFASLFERHPMLDVTFSVDDGQPVQNLRKGGTIDFREHDARKLGDEEIRARVVEQAIRPFDLEHGPVIRLELFRTRDDAHVVLFSMHHIISDAWSIALLFNDLIESYFAIQAGRTPDYAPLEHRYSDFVAWEQKELNGSAGEALRSYWNRELAGAPTTLNLPIDHPRPAAQTFNGANHGFQLGEKLTKDVVALANAQRATLYTTLLSAFNALIHRYANRDDMIVGSPMAGRLQPELRRIIGYFVNPVPVRSRVDDDPSFTDFLKRNTQTVNGAIEHQNYPVSRLVTDLNVPRDPSRSPLFQVAFAMESTPGSDDKGIAVFLIGQGGHQFSVGPVTIETFDISLRQAQFEITLVVQEAGGRLYGSWQYNRDLFEPETIERLSGLFERILEQIVANPETKISELKLLAGEEQTTILETWNATEADYPRGKPLHQLVAEQAAVTPEAPAVTCGGRTLTYGDLEARANGLAVTLRAEGVVPGESVAVLASRSADMVVGMLGVLKSGGCYVPLDPAFPSFRLQQMLDDAKPRVLLTGRALEDEAPAGRWATLFLDEVKSADVVMTNEDLGPASLAYIIYTSGSTGTPKGVEIPHRAVVNFLSSMRRRPGLTRVDKLLAVTTISFDISVLEIFLPLVVGGQVVIAEEDDTRDGRRLSALLEEHDISVMQATPATWRMLLDSGWEGKNGLRILCGGEALPRDLANLLVNSADELWNLYGPTETTIWSTCERISENDGAVTIGTPIDNTRIYVLDENEKPVPIGFVGDLYIGGDGLACGYHGQPETTDGAFLDVTLPNDRTERLYRTGDLARWNGNGTLECLGRSDFQIKLRGVRMELEEIEIQLASHPSVRQAVVAKRDDLPGGEALVAYIIGDDNASELKAHLAGRLPDAMHPAFYCFVDAFPLTPNRKIDRKRLPAPDLGRKGLGSKHLPPQTASERVLWEIFNEAFAPREVGIRDNFFELGGDSLLAVRIVTQVSASFNRDVPVAAFLTHPTIEQLGRYLHNEPGAEPLDTPLATRADFDDDYLSVEVGATELPAIDAAALACIPDAFLPLTGLDRNELVHDWFGNAPRLTNHYDTPLGRIGLVMLPCFELDLYKDPASVKDVTLDALRLAAGAGAKNVSLTGVIPSATNHGLDISAWINGSTDLPIITTGDATRTATVVRSIEGILTNSQRDFAEESLAIIGLGSIGKGTLELVLEVLPHPREITLCDFYGEDERLEGIRDQLLASGYEGEIRIARANGRLPAEVYEASFVIGSTSVPGIIDVNKLRAGALLVDYSFPPAFRALDAARRLEEQGDILFTIGGQLKLGDTIPETIYLPEDVESLVKDLDPARLHALAGREANEITGCVLASLVTGQTPDVRVTLGEVKPEDCLAHYKYLKSLPADPARLQIEGYTISDEDIARFRGETPTSPPVTAR